MMNKVYKGNATLPNQQRMQYSPQFYKGLSTQRHNGYLSKNSQESFYRFDGNRLISTKQKSYSCAHRKREKSRSSSKPNNIYTNQQPYNTKKHKHTLRQQQIKQQYNLQNVQKKNIIPTSTTTCQFSLQNCKHIQTYLQRIKNQLRQQKQKNKILKRRNNQLTKQNKVFNQYFQTFQPKYQQLMTICGYNQQERNNRVRSVSSNKHAKHYKSHEKVYIPSKLHCHNKKEQVIVPATFSKLTSNTTDPIKSSFITNKSSINKSKQHLRYDQFHSYA